MLQELAANSEPAPLGRHCHFRYLIDTLPHRNQSDTAHRLRAQICHEDPSTSIKNFVFRVAQGFTIRFFQGEVAGDPLFVQSSESTCVFSCPERAYLNFCKIVEH